MCNLCMKEIILYVFFCAFFFGQHDVDESHLCESCCYILFIFVSIYIAYIVYIDKKAVGSKSNSECESLMLSKESISDTIPVIDSRTDKADIGHEASIGKISDEAIFYLTSRGITEEEAKKLIVRGFAEPISKSLPLEYAVEMNRLIEMELEGANRINDKKLKIK